VTSPIDPDGNNLAEARLAVLAAVTQGDAGIAFDVIGGLMSDGLGFESILFDVIAPLQADVGTRWQQGDIAIAEEHAATGAIETLVALLAGTLLTPEEGPLIIVVTAEGDAHSLPARMLAAYLLYLGWRVTFLGASVPAADLGPYLSSVEADALVLSCALVSRLTGARASVAAAHEAGVPVLVGGRALGTDDARARAIGADAWAASPSDVDTILRTWHPDPAAAELAVADTAEVELLEDVRLQVVSAATELTRSSDRTGATHRGSGSDLQLLYDGLLGALLVAEPGLLGELAVWHDHLHAHHATPAPAELLLEGLRTATVPYSPAAVTYLDEALRAIES
jgi:methanogenic corrinoid protein MtbC1